MTAAVNGINRNIVECKAFSVCSPLENTAVLIETLWNVKKKLPDFRRNLLLSINRNIVECKVMLCFCMRMCVCVLIETLWNVKTKTYDPNNEFDEVLIETLWNVK